MNNLIFGNKHHPHDILLIGVFAILMFAGCGSVYQDTTDRGDTYMLRDGYPEFAITAQPYLSDANSINLNVWTDVVKGSLIFSNDSLARDEQSNLSAQFTIEVNLFSSKNLEQILGSKQVTHTLKAQNNRVTEAQTSEQYQINVNDVPPGTYWLRVALFDHTSEKSTARGVPVTIPDPAQSSQNPLLTPLILEGTYADHPYAPISTYTVPARYDSLQYRTEIWHQNSSENELSIEVKLIRFHSDQHPARNISGRDYSPSSIRYQGIDFDNTTAILKDTLSVNLNDGYATPFTYAVKRPNIGNYRFTVSIISGDQKVSKEMRAFGVKSPWFPALQTMRELAAPLIYLMNKKEHDKMMKISDAQKLKQAYDQFWLDNIEDPSVATDVVQKFNERVVEANKQFTNYKAGWKTDLGMIYILFGPPWYVENRADKMKWSYAYDRDDPRFNFIFDRYRYKNKHYPFYNYRLLRDRFYFEVGYRQRELWLNGTILTREIY